MARKRKSETQLKVHLAAKVDPPIAEAIKAMARDGYRTVSRQVELALIEHVQRSQQAQPRKR